MTKNLPKKLQQAPFSWAEAKKAGLSQYTLNALLKSGSVERMSRGVYRCTDGEIDISPENQYKAALIQVGGPSAICLISSLAYFHLTDILPKQIWVMVNASKLSIKKDIRLWRRRDPKWNIGVTRLDGLKITNIERTLVECLHYKDLIGGATVALEAVRLALREKKTTVSNLLRMAERLNLKKKILPYIEILS